MQNSEWLFPPEKHLVFRTSFFKSYLKCPAQAMFRYFKGIIIPPGSAATVGTCIHKPAEHQNKHKMKKGRDLKVSVLQDVCNEEFKVRTKQTAWRSYERPDKIKTHVIKNVIPVYHKELGKKLNPIYVEEPFSLEFPKVNATLTGAMDVVVKGPILRALKSKGRVPDWMDVFKSFQKRSYWLGHEAKFGKSPKKFVLDYIIRTKTPKYVPSEPNIVQPYEITEFIHLIEMIVMEVRRGIFYPKREGNILCSPQWCGYWTMCNKCKWMDLPLDGKVYMGNDGKETN